jgi:hypothetical protein
MNTNFQARTQDEAKTAPGRRPLARLADDKMRAGASATTMLGRVLKDTGRKSIEVAAFGSSV